MLNWDKGKDEQKNSSADYIQNMSKEMDIICEELSEETKTFKAKDFFDKIHKYIMKNDRLIYTHITNYIFTLTDMNFGILQTNIDSVVSYMYSDEYQQDFSKWLDDRQKKRELERTQRTVLKMWDHVNLARRQYLMFHQKDTDYEKIVDEKMEIVGAKISKEMNVQLISLVAIFTALSFLVFGGISSLDNIFDGAKNIPILKLIVVGSVWGFCIMNMLFVFIYFISKIAKLNLSSTDDVNTSVLKKYPLVCWCNLVVISIFALSSWAVYIRGEELSVKLYEIIYKNQTVVFIIGTLVIIGILIVAGKILYNNIKK